MHGKRRKIWRFQGLEPRGHLQRRSRADSSPGQKDADKAELEYGSAFKCITLDVHSSLEAVGLTAVVSGRLAERGISANVIAAYYHDHIFVPTGMERAALAALN